MTTRHSGDEQGDDIWWHLHRRAATVELPVVRPANFDAKGDELLDGSEHRVHMTFPAGNRHHESSSLGHSIIHDEQPSVAKLLLKRQRDRLLADIPRRGRC